VLTDVETVGARATQIAHPFSWRLGLIVAAWGGFLSFTLEVVWIRKNFFDECTIASKIVNFRPSGATTLEGFGSSDCRCPSHLIYFPSNTKAIRSLGNQLGFEKVKIDENKL